MSDEGIEERDRTLAWMEYERDQHAKAAAFDRAVRSAEQRRAPTIRRAILVDAPHGLGAEGSIYRVVTHVYTEDMRYIGKIDPCPGGAARDHEAQG